jgi:uncharacterized protein YjbI with pentapeptide repeats
MESPVEARKPTQKITCWWNDAKVLYECEADSIREALLKAVASGADLRGANLSGADLRGADLREADLREADLRGANLREANLRWANLSGADLREANLRGANLSEANLRGANLSGANLRGANLRWADLRGANLSGANLRGANLSEADLREADLRGANLREANLRGANLSGANLSGANLSGANLTTIRDDFWAVLCAAPHEAISLRNAIVAGKVDGSAYEGECACLVGTIANARQCAWDAVPGLTPNSNRPAERFFLAIKPGDTPENSQFSRLVLEWLDDWHARMAGAFDGQDWPQPVGAATA